MTGLLETHWATDLGDLLADPLWQLVLFMAIVAVGMRLLGSHRDRQVSQQRAKARPKPRRHWHWPFTRKRIPWKLGPVTVDLRGGHHTVHAVVAGMSGTGKSTAVLPLLMGKTPALVVAFDNSRPIRDLFESKGWTIWTPGGTLGWDILSGPAQVVSEALVAGMPESNQSMGIMSGMAQERIWETLDALDAAHRPRTIDALADALSVRTGNAIQDRACLDWAVRFRRVAKSLGPSLGTDLDLGDAMRHGDKILILPNRFLSPKDAPLVGAMALVQARRVAQEVGDFLLIVEEAGQAGQRQIEMNALAQAGRDRGCPLIVLTQNMAKLPEEVINNVKVWVSFAQESSRELAFAAERLRTDLNEFIDLPTGHAWVRSPDHNPTRVKLSLPKFQKPIPQLTIPLSTIPPSLATVPAAGGTIEPELNEEQEEAATAVPVWVTDDPDRQRFWSRMRREECGCLRWLGGDNGQGRPKGHLTVVGADGRKKKISPTVYVLTYEWVNGEDSAEPTLDHLCHTNDETCPGNNPCAWQDCQNPMHPTGEPCQHGLCCEDTHLEPVSIQINQERNAAQKRRYQLWKSRVPTRAAT